VSRQVTEARVVDEGVPLEAPEPHIRRAHFTVPLHLDGARECTVTIEEHPADREGLRTYVVVRPKGRRQTYSLPLAAVAEMVAWKVAKERAR
jgi:hypothetical protein